MNISTIRGAAFLCADLGITPEIRDDHDAYLGHRLTVLREEAKKGSVHRPVEW